MSVLCDLEWPDRPDRLLVHSHLGFVIVNIRDSRLSLYYSFKDYFDKDFNQNTKICDIRLPRKMGKGIKIKNYINCYDLGRELGIPFIEITIKNVIDELLKTHPEYAI